ncbi:hypothetical protein HJB86_27655 [Rhizobium sp. NZLR3b]|uniref:hypothetical protein n=1 Tax=Rhizobium sp. NZLR3b TaxID=2731101 RepID=UPI001C83963E|nr:hypothetical protein [Rhizobium sp. NZLR3b]MBX5192618.1 hypothetical protein [Rhizobium sp. NZLR3b]
MDVQEKAEEAVARNITNLGGLLYLLAHKWLALECGPSWNRNDEAHTTMAAVAPLLADENRDQGL